MCLTNRERNTRGTRGTQEAQEKSSAPSLPDRGSVTACFEGSRRNVLTLYIHSVILFLVRFTWDPDKAAENVRNHKGVTLEGTEIFSDPNLQEEFDGMHSDDEPRYLAIGLSSRRLLQVVFTEPEEGVIHIISARKASAKERKLYEEK